MIEEEWRSSSIDWLGAGELQTFPFVEIPIGEDTLSCCMHSEGEGWALYFRWFT